MQSQGGLFSLSSLNYWCFRSRVERTPPAALLNGDVQIYKWVWWRSRPWKIISSFAISERNSSRALCPLQTQFSNEKRCAPSFPPSLPPTTTTIHLSSAHPRELWGIHSFKCWSQDWDACSVNYFQNQRMRRRDLFWGQTCGPWRFPHSAPYVLLLKMAVSEHQNKQNNGVHADICTTDLLNKQDVSWCSVQLFPMT